MKPTNQYINLEAAVAAIYHNSNADDFHVKVAAAIEEACKLLETGFEFVTDVDGKKLFRKRSERISEYFPRLLGIFLCLHIPRTCFCQLS
jgi:hypothetical protein